MLSPVATENQYQPGNGLNVDFANVAARNLVYLVASNDQGALIGSLVNKGTSAASVTIASAGGTSTQISVDALGKTDFGYNGSVALPLGIVAKPGTIAEITITVDGAAQTVKVPVLDGTFSEYAGLIAEPSATPKP
ncbi:MAG: hypothetical protein RLZZ164_1041 [Actinomycetota bacterium]|jgi:hypothetical protein